MAELVSLPGSAVQYPRGVLQDLYSVADWYPNSHPPMPAVVREGRKPKLYACAYCHLADGSGRPENAVLAGLPAAYIQQQIAAFADGSRRSAAGDDYLPFAAMHQIAAAAKPEEVAEAAIYFSRQRTPPKLTVRETETVGHPSATRFLFAVDPAAREPMASRIVETPEDLDAHELHDPKVRYIAYVPMGAIERGRRLATAGPDGAATSCFACHGADLRGTPTAPPLAGHFATYLFRQLLAFRNGARNDPLAVLMRPVVAKLTIDEMVDLAAFAATLAR